MDRDLGIDVSENRAGLIHVLNVLGSWHTIILENKQVINAAHAYCLSLTTAAAAPAASNAFLLLIMHSDVFASDRSSYYCLLT